MTSKSNSKIPAIISVISAFLPASDSFSEEQQPGFEVAPQYAPLAAGSAHSLVRCENGYVFSWGSNSSGQLGDGTGLDAYNPVAVRDEHYEPVEGLTAIAAGADHSLALKLDGSVIAWGANDSNQVFDSAFDTAYTNFYQSTPDAYAGPYLEAPFSVDGSTFDTPVSVLEPDSSPAGQIRAVAAYGSLSAALRVDGSVIAWGNTGFLLNSNSTTSTGSNTGQTDTTNTTATTSGTDNSSDTNTDSSVASSMLVLRGVNGDPVYTIKSIATGDQHIIGLTSAGNALIWDPNAPVDRALLHEGGERAAYAQSDQNPDDASPYFDPSKNTEDQADTLRATYVRDVGGRIVAGIRQISAAAEYSIVVLDDGQVMVLGTSTIPFLTNGVVTPSAISDGSSSVTAASTTSGEDGRAHFVRRNDGKRLTGVRAAAAGKDHALFLLNSGQVVSMGANDSGQLGANSNSVSDGSSAMVEVVDSAGSPVKNIVAVATGDQHSLALSRQGVVYAWGNGDSGKLGDGSNVSSFSVVPVRDTYNRQFNINYSCQPLY